MTCCPAPAGAAGGGRTNAAVGIHRHVRDVAGGREHIDLVVPDMHCAACIAKIEKTLQDIDGVAAARVNFSTRRVAVEWSAGALDPTTLIDALARLGYRARPYSPGSSGEKEEAARGQQLLAALAVAGFAAGNVMLLSVSVWAGAGAATRDLFHWISAMIALPAIAWAGRPFFASAWRAARSGSLNMDVPISLAVMSAAVYSLAETTRHAEHVYFDAAVTLVFFLLVGRYLDHMMRTRARSAATRLLSLAADEARVVDDNGSEMMVPIEDVCAGMTVAVAPGEQLPVDGIIASGHSDVDRSLVTGESVPESVAPGDEVQAGAVNLTGALRIKVSASGEDTFLAGVIRVMEAAETAKAGYVRLAERAAGIYAPAVHVLAAATLVGWLVAGAGWHFALFTAISVLIITCPCALGLAAPAVQVVASGVLLARGVMVKDAAGLERLGEVDTVVFDKTGTLTLGDLEVERMEPMSAPTLAMAGAVAGHSRHPLAQALAREIAARGIIADEAVDVIETPGFGVSGRVGGRVVRIGNAKWCAFDGGDDEAAASGPRVIVAVEGERPRQVRFRDRLRMDARQCIGELKERGLSVAILSGDVEPVVAALARELGVDEWRGALTPTDKSQVIADMTRAGRKVAMVGDGINDAPALAAAHASLAPASASDIGQSAAGLVFMGERLGAVVDSYDVAVRSRRLVKQNFVLAGLYNAVAVPLAVAGLASPLVAAIAMSSSSMLVTANALRLRLSQPARRQTGGHGQVMARSEEERLAA